jgi:hypothetical protein
LIEVKSSKQRKAEHLTDIAFQKAVLESAGLVVPKCSLLLISEDYRKTDGPLDHATFFRQLDVTEEVDAVAKFVHEQALLVAGAMLNETAPDEIPNVHCVRDGGCSYIKHCFSGLPKHDVTSLPMIRREAVLDLHAIGVRDIAQIPLETKLSDRQRLVASVVRTGVPYVSPKLCEVLSSIAYPIHFVDFEAVGTALPEYAGVAPYEPVPFQWSDHILDSPDEERHAEYLCEEGDPRRGFCERLWETLAGAETIVHYAAYEKTILKLLVAANVPHSRELAALFDKKGLDLERVVKEHVYLAEFMGKTSIKRVYPALVPHSGYGDLDIKDGDHAAAEYRRMTSAATTVETKRAIAQSLKLYCHRDTQAMVEVFRALIALSKPA